MSLHFTLTPSSRSTVCCGRELSTGGTWGRVSSLSPSPTLSLTLLSSVIIVITTTISTCYHMEEARDHCQEFGLEQATMLVSGLCNELIWLWWSLGRSWWSLTVTWQETGGYHWVPGKSSDRQNDFVDRLLDRCSCAPFPFHRCNHDNDVESCLMILNSVELAFEEPSSSSQSLILPILVSSFSL